MPALLQRFFQDMASVLANCYEVLRLGGEAMIVIGDNRMRVDGGYEKIATTDFVQEIAVDSGMELIERIDISVDDGEPSPHETRNHRECSTPPQGSPKA